MLLHVLQIQTKNFKYVPSCKLVIKKTLHTSRVPEIVEWSAPDSSSSLEKSIGVDLSFIAILMPLLPLLAAPCDMGFNGDDWKQILSFRFWSFSFHIP